MASDTAFRTTRKVRFADCDPAGIVFFPRYYEMLNGLVEDWFEDMGAPFQELVVAAEGGVPSVKIETEFLAASQIGDALTLALSVVRIGRTSATLDLSVEHGAETRLKSRHTVVYTVHHRPTPWPDALRARMTERMAP